VIAQWMLYGLGVSALVALVAFALEHTLRLFRKPTRWVWLFSIIACTTIPIVAPVLRKALPAPSLAPPAVDIDLNVQALVGPDDGPLTLQTMPAPPAVQKSRWTSLTTYDTPLVIAWIGGTLFLLLMVARTAIGLAVQRRSWRSVKIHGDRVLVSEDIGPAVIGFAHMRVVLPEWALTMDESFRSLMLQHEREHVRAGDPRLLLLGAVCAAIFPWNVVLWWQLRRLRAAVEIDCDSRVLSKGRSIEQYGRLLILVGEHFSTRSPLTRAAFAEPSSLLARRIDAMCEGTPPQRSHRLVGSGLLAVGASVTVLAIQPPSMGDTYSRYAALVLETISAPVSPSDAAPTRGNLVNASTTISSPTRTGAELGRTKRLNAAPPSPIVIEATQRGQDRAAAHVDAIMSSIAQRMDPASLGSLGSLSAQTSVSNQSVGSIKPRSFVPQVKVDLPVENTGQPSAANTASEPPPVERSYALQSSNYKAPQVDQTREALHEYFPGVLTGENNDSVFVMIYGTDNKLRLVKSIISPTPGGVAKITWDDLVSAGLETPAPNSMGSLPARKSSKTGGFFSRIAGFEVTQYEPGVYGPRSISVVTVIVK
jgi:hypothetical protein